MSLLETLKSLVTPELLSKASGLLGDSEGALGKGLAAALPTMVLGAGSQAADSPGLAKAFDLLKGHDAGSDPVASSGNMADGNPISEFLQSILGDKADAITSLIGNFSGVKGASAGGLMAIASGLLMNFLGGKVKTDGLNPAGLVSMVGQEKDSLMAALPAGLGSLLGGAKAANASVSAPVVNAPEVTMPAASKWLLPALVGILGIGGFGIFQSCQASKAAGDGHGEVAKEAPAKAVAAPSENKEAPMAVAGQPGMFEFKLPNGKTIIGSESGIEGKLIAFVSDAGKMVDKTTWFNFDRLLFDTGKSTLKAESKDQLSNITAILSAFPKVKLKIGGYTDNVGDKNMNMKLSADRATSVMSEIVGMGVAPDRLESEGYGDQHPEGDNNTEEGRAMNRRIAARVTEK